MGRVHLIGVDHFDPRGSWRLRKLIESISPDVLVLEYDARLVKEVEEFYRLPLRERKELLRVPGANESTLEFYAQQSYYEYLVAKESSIPFVLADTKHSISAESAESSMRARGETMRFSLLEIQREIDRRYCKPRDCSGQIRELEMRDDAMEAEVRKLSGTIAFPIGYDHIVGDYHNLAQRLSDLEPSIRLLPHAEFLR